MMLDVPIPMNVIERVIRDYCESRKIHCFNVHACYVFHPMEANSKLRVRLTVAFAEGEPETTIDYAKFCDPLKYPNHYDEIGEIGTEVVGTAVAKLWESVTIT